jgi:hypothetical protein
MNRSNAFLNNRQVQASPFFKKEKHISLSDPQNQNALLVGNQEIPVLRQQQSLSTLYHPTLKEMSRHQTTSNQHRHPYHSGHRWL